MRLLVSLLAGGWFHVGFAQSGGFVVVFSRWGCLCIMAGCLAAQSAAKCNWLNVQ